jgi:hypothetical protein
VCALHKLAQDFLMTAMDTIEDTYRQPGVLERKIFEGMIVNHNMVSNITTCSGLVRKGNSLIFANLY